MPINYATLHEGSKRMAEEKKQTKWKAVAEKRCDATLISKGRRRSVVVLRRWYRNELCGEISVRIFLLWIQDVFYTSGKSFLTNMEIRIDPKAVYFCATRKHRFKKAFEDYRVSLSWAELGSCFHEDWSTIVTKQRKWNKWLEFIFKIFLLLYAVPS